MLNTKYFKKRSKKGFTLVEAICAVFVLAIVFVGILNAVAFSRQMVYSNNSREKASYKGQLVADEILSAATGYDPDGSDDPIPVIDAVVNNTTDDPQNADPETAIGAVDHVGVLTEPESFEPSVQSNIQYTIEKVTESSEDFLDGGVSYVEITEKGWNITVRVFYQEIGANDDYKCVDISAFAPYNYIS